MKTNVRVKGFTARTVRCSVGRRDVHPRSLTDVDGVKRCGEAEFSNLIMRSLAKHHWGTGVEDSERGYLV